MSKKILVLAVLFAIALSMTVSQEANALTKGMGQYSHTTASLDPSRVCGNQLCAPGENSKWSHAVMDSQREGRGKATGGFHGYVIMHQLVVNSLVIQTSSNVEMTSVKTGNPTSESIGMPNANNVMKSMKMSNQTNIVPMSNQTNIVPMSNQTNIVPMSNQTNTGTNSTG
jgi:hypothetical protein